MQVNSPRLAILDEASSALDLETERALYKLLEERRSLTYISVGHRSLSFVKRAPAALV